MNYPNYESVDPFNQPFVDHNEAHIADESILKGPHGIVTDKHGNRTVVAMPEKKDRNIVVINDAIGTKHALRIRDMIAVSLDKNNIILRYASGLSWSITLPSLDDAYQKFNDIMMFMNSSYVD